MQIKVRKSQLRRKFEKEVRRLEAPNLRIDKTVTKDSLEFARIFILVKLQTKLKSGETRFQFQREPIARQSLVILASRRLTRVIVLSSSIFS